ncbi:MAG TPA: hypothetical protein VKU85_16920 [bacterium]|nr:hypothetical protein [bacterium]
MIHLLAILGLGAACAGWAALRLTARRRRDECGGCRPEASCPVDRLLAE